jgi:hypothetical protein
MNTRTPRKAVGPEYAGQRLRIAQQFHADARALLHTLGGDANCVSVQSLTCLAAIAYADAVTAHRRGLVNQQDHQRAPDLLREVLGGALPATQETRLRRALGGKDEAQYGVRPLRHAKAEEALQALDDFGAWASEQLKM